MPPPRDAESVGALARKLAADGRAYAAAKIDVYRQKALSWVPPVRTAAIFGVLALFIAQAALTALFVLIGVWLSFWLGPLGGGITAALLGFALAGLLAWRAVAQFKGPRP